MKQRTVRHAWIVVALASTAVPAFGADSIGKALKEGHVVLDLRYRFERVEQDGFDEDAEASTLRLRLGYQTGKVRGFSVFADFEHVEVVGAEKYNSTANGLIQFPLVADPEGTELGQAYLAYSGLKNTEFKLGRHRFTLGNKRFIGNVGWRQNEQTYDAFSVTGKLPGEVSFAYAHLSNANRVFGEDNPDPLLADLDLAADLLHASHEYSAGTLTAYAHFMELKDIPAASHRNLGLRFSGAREVARGTALLYTLEATDQSDYADGASTVDASYQLIELGVGTRRLTARLGYEVLGGDGTYGFSTPLATLHAFNGWTDQFLVTPATGLEDLYLSVAGRLAGLELTGVYHDFAADEGGASHGSEWGVNATRTFKKRYTVGVKYASYDADTFSVDTDKLWITLQLVHGG